MKHNAYLDAMKNYEEAIEELTRPGINPITRTPEDIREAAIYHANVRIVGDGISETEAKYSHYASNALWPRILSDLEKKIVNEITNTCYENVRDKRVALVAKWPSLRDNVRNGVHQAADAYKREAMQSLINAERYESQAEATESELARSNFQGLALGHRENASVQAKRADVLREIAEKL